MTTSNVPVVVEEDAARLIARFQIQQEMDRMIAWARDNVPDVLGIRVAASRGRPPLPDLLVIWAYWEAAGKRERKLFPEFDFIDWKMAHFPFPVCQRVSVWCTPGPVGAACA